MFRAFALPAVIAIGCVAYSQPVTVQPATIPGIEIIGPESPDFAAAVTQIVGTDQPRNFAAWLPYSVVVKNNSSQTLAAITVAWTASFNGEPLHRAGGTMANWFNLPSRQIQPGRSVLALPQTDLQRPRDLIGFTEGRGLGNLPNFQSAQKLGVSVDSVVFASGQYVGLDTLHEYERYEAEINVPRSVAQSLLQKKATTPISDILAWLQTLAATQRVVDDYNGAQSKTAARGLLNRYSNRGEAALYAQAQSILEQPAFPLHR